MSLTECLCALTLKGVVGGACVVMDLQAGAGAVDGVVGFLTGRFVDHSQALSRALRRSNTHAWKTLEVALAGDSFWDRCKLAFTSAEDRAFREQVKPFLDSCSLAELSGREQFRQDCLRELRAANKANLLDGGELNPRNLAEQAGTFARYNDPQALLDAEGQALASMGELLKQAGYPNLAGFVSLRPQRGDSLLVIAARYFFRRCIEEDSALFQGLAFAQLETLQAGQETALANLQRTLAEHGDRIETVLLEVHTTLIVVKETVTATHGAVLDLRAEQQRQSEQTRDLYQAVLDLQHKLDLTREVRPRDSMSIRTEGERQLVKQLVGRYRSLPEEQRRHLPALLNGLGKLQVATGDFRQAQDDFAFVAELVGEPRAQAEAHHNSFRAALERRDWSSALAEIQRASQLDPQRFAPFPLNKYLPQRILGAGGFGVAFLCRHKYMNADVVVKTLTLDDLDRDMDQLFGEAQVLRQLDHPAIIRLQDCGFASSHDESRPYVVMDYFEGQTLEELARETPLAVEDLVSVARQMAEGLHAAHGQNILHRDVKPANVLVRKTGGGWQVKLIDFGLALKKSGRETLLATTNTLTGSSIAGTLDYAAPEQMGKLPGTPVRPCSDVYGFGRTCCYALFGTPQPLMRHWRTLPDVLAELLESCLEDAPSQRPQDFQAVLDRLTRLSPTPAAPVAVKPTAPTPLPQVPERPAPASKSPDQMSKEERQQALDALAMQAASCTRCPQLVRNRTQAVFGGGALDAEVCFLGEAPGGEEDIQGRPFVGEAGKVLMSILQAMGFQRDEVYITNILKCRPPGNRTPWTSEASNCRDFLERQMQLVKPKFIVALGGCASQNLLGTTQYISKLRGRFHDWQNIPVLCTYHPAFLLPNRSPEKKKDVWDDMKLLLQRMGRPIPRGF